jgi:lysophospholipid acyltransferase (LPLAT)-like uncharacterized protein
MRLSPAETILVRLVAVYLSFVGWTSRYHLESPWTLEELRSAGKNGRRVYAFWHNRIAYFCWLFRGTGISIPISTHRDGRLIAAVARRFGYGIIEGSTSREPVRVLKSILSSIARGTTVAITPDGPRGPLYSLQDGLFFSAWKSGVPIVGGAWYAKHVVRFKSWDRFILPLPFNTFIVKFTKAFDIPSREAIPGIKIAFKEEFDRITNETETYFAAETA